MIKIDAYPQMLRKLHDWVPFLRKNSGLQGPRGNLELAHAVTQEGNQKQVEHFLTYQADENTPEFLSSFVA